ncbi:MAG: hypothetical protein M3N93_03605 [Acidobacteriota bacterium]|nr:hypothetical protein [Acidobacteriota bacterium]
MMRVVLYFGGMLIGPLVLIVGSALVLNGMYAKPGALLALSGCAVLTIFVGYQSLQALHVEPLQVKPPYLLYAVAVVVALLSDVGAFRLYRLTSVALD